MRSALQWGGLTGLGAYLVGRIILTYGAMLLFGNGPSDLNHPGILTSACLGIFAILFAFSAAGYFTGRDTRRAGLGAVAGMVAMAVYSVLSVIPLPVPGTATAPATPQPSQPAINPVAQVISFLVATVVVFGIAALMGWLGGRPGAANARKRVLAAERAAAERAG